MSKSCRFAGNGYPEVQMNGIATRVRKALVAASVLGALGFGTTQAFAGPGAGKAPPTCSPGQCDKQCKEQFGQFASGTCDPFGGCSCAV
jgi:hypothetical protein